MPNFHKHCLAAKVTIDRVMTHLRPYKLTDTHPRICPRSLEVYQKSWKQNGVDRVDDLQQAEDVFFTQTVGQEEKHKKKCLSREAGTEILIRDLPKGDDCRGGNQGKKR